MLPRNSSISCPRYRTWIIVPKVLCLFLISTDFCSAILELTHDQTRNNCKVKNIQYLNIKELGHFTGCKGAILIIHRIWDCNKFPPQHWRKSFESWNLRWNRDLVVPKPVSCYHLTAFTAYLPNIHFTPYSSSFCLASRAQLAKAVCSCIFPFTQWQLHKECISKAWALPLNLLWQHSAHTA